MTFLLDVNVLIALIDLTHLNHDPVHAWFAADGHHSWATCPIPKTAFLRIDAGRLPRSVAQEARGRKDFFFKKKEAKNF